LALLLVRHHLVCISFTFYRVLTFRSPVPLSRNTTPKTELPSLFSLTIAGPAALAASGIWQRLVIQLCLSKLLSACHLGFPSSQLPFIETIIFHDQALPGPVCSIPSSSDFRKVVQNNLQLRPSPLQSFTYLATPTLHTQPWTKSHHLIAVWLTTSDFGLCQSRPEHRRCHHHHGLQQQYSNRCPGLRWLRLSTMKPD
jgi:hypothetical protein